MPGPTRIGNGERSGDNLRASLQLLASASIPIPRIIRLAIGEHVPQPKVPKLPLPKGPTEALSKSRYDGPPWLAFLSVD